ncbi:MAG: alpha/beta hydrolase [Nocardioidaceae bacterium]
MRSLLRRAAAQVRTRLESWTLRATLALPPGLLRRIVGHEVWIDGQRLDREVQALLRLERLTGAAPVESLPLVEGRARLDSDSAMVGGRQPIGAVADHVIPGPGGDLAARLYTPHGMSGVAPLLVYFHGGGWIFGSLDSHDAVCRFLAERAGVRVLAVDYRLAPEHPFPAAVDDAVASYEWVCRHASLVEADSRRIAVGGDSAGGNLAAVVAWVARDAGKGPAFQLLLYPATDLAGRTESRRLFGRGFYLTDEYIDRAGRSYLTPETAVEDPRVSPLHLADASGLCPAYVATAGFDPLRDEGAAYAHKLADAGVPVELRRFEGLIHSFVNMVGVGRSCPAAMREVAEALHAGLAGADGR